MPLSATFGQNLVQNPSFESLGTVSAPAAGSFTTVFTTGAALPNWTVFVNNIDLHHWQHGSMGVPPGGGIYHIDLNQLGGIRQTIPTFLPGTYQYSFWRNVHSSAACTGNITSSLTIQEGANPPLVSQTYTLTSADRGTWVQETGTFTVGTTLTNVDVIFRNQATCYGNGSMLVDSVRVVRISEPSDCSDECYWKVTGNNILNGNNIFGTLTDDHVVVKTSSTDRGIITNNGLLGWNTMAPTSYLHVNCTGNIPEQGGGASDIRFERLEHGSGYLLVIDDNGFVYNSRIRADKASPTDDGELRQLRQEIAELKSRLNSLAGENNTGNTLSQNTPNPFGNETRIDYTVTRMQQSAAILILDLSGKELRRYNIDQGTGSVRVDGSGLAAGVYLYSLVVDGREAETKRMVLSR